MQTHSLRPYQVDSVEQLRQHFRNGSKRPLLVAPTGSGKTTVANYIIEGAVAKGGRAVFLAARRELVHQASARLSTRHGVILSGNRRVDQEAPVQVASVQTLLNRDLPWEPTLIILDEAHHSTARTHQELLQRYPDTPVIGLSATPVRTTGLGLADYFTSMVQSIGISSLIQQGYLVPVRHLRPPERGKSLYADPVEMWLRHAADRPTMAFASNVQESIALVERFNHRGIPALHIDANTPDEIRDTVSQQMESGAIKVVSGYAVYVEGVDIPCLSCVILDRKTSSLPVYLQAIGRGLRAYPGKENCQIHDHGGNVYEHGRADCDRTWVLTHGKDVLVGATTPDVADNYRVCPICYTVADAPQTHCTCGYKFSVKRKKTYKHQAGTLELHHDDGRITVIPEDKRRKEYERFLWQQRNGKKKDGSPLSPRYASFRFFQQYGVWPPKEWAAKALP